MHNSQARAQRSFVVLSDTNYIKVCWEPSPTSHTPESTSSSSYVRCNESPIDHRYNMFADSISC